MLERISQVHHRNKAYIDLIFTSSNQGTLWLVLAIIALSLHCILISFFICFRNPEDLGNISAGPREIAMELYSPPDGASAMNDSPQSTDDVEAKDMKFSSPVPPQITSPEADYPSDMAAAYADTFTPSEDEREKLKKKNSAEKAISFESSESSAHTAADTAIPQKQTETAQTKEERIRITWQKQLVTHLARHRSYPKGSTNLNAKVTLNFVLNRNGHVVSSSIIQSSGDSNIDQAALTMMHRSDPVPPPPPSVADRGLIFTLPIVFSKNTRKELPRKF